MPSSSFPPPAADVVPRLAVRDPDAWLKLASWAMIIACALAVLTFSFGRDQGIYALVAEGILKGKVPYRDVWDFKPPGIFFVYALAQAVFGNNMLAPRLLEVLALLANVAILRRLGGTLFDSRMAGLLGAAIAALIHAEFDFWHTGQPETFGATLTLLALLLTVEEAPRERYRALQLVGVGLCFGAAALLKPPLGGGVLVCAAYAAQKARLRGAARLKWLIDLAWIALGAALPVGLCLAWFAWKGGFAAMSWTLGEFTPGYTLLSWEGRRASDMLYHAIEELFFKFSALVAAGIIAEAALPSLCRREREGLLLTLGIIAIHVTGIAMQGKFFAYHYGATLPIVSLLAGLGLYKLWRLCLVGGLGGGLAFFSFVAVAIPMRYAVRDLPQYFWERCWIRYQFILKLAPFDTREAMDAELAYVADYNLEADRKVALEVAQLTRPDENVFVWGFEPAIYWLSQRQSASRFIYNVPQRSPWQAGYARQSLIRDLDRAPPRVLVLQTRDVFPAVTGNGLDSKDSLPDFPELALRVERDYEFVKRVEDFEILLRR